MKKTSKVIIGSLLLLLTVMFMPSSQVVTKAAANGFVTQNGKTYFFENGIKHTGWLKYNGKTYYFDKNGVQKKGWAYYQGKKYRYFSSGSGVMLTGFVKNSAGIYHFANNGVLSYGWVKIGADRYYGNTRTGLLVKGWVNAGNNKRYFYSSNGRMAKGWVKSGNNIRYFDEATGYMSTGFKVINKNLYNFNTKNGYMNKNLILKYNGSNYYFGNDGIGINISKLKVEDLEVTSTENLKNLGNFRITFYCPCAVCNGNSSGLSATGTKLTPKHTVAVDPSVIPLGSVLFINGQIYFAEDTGVRGKVIDILVPTHADCYKQNFDSANVYLLGKL
ncbi:MAG: 3D domain-containing protein [Eubacteriales bacterium]|nr:3D domain-containing protein [Eubacteriales bacterium]